MSGSKIKEKLINIKETIAEVAAEEQSPFQQITAKPFALPMSPEGVTPKLKPQPFQLQNFKEGNYFILKAEDLQNLINSVNKPKIDM